MAEEKEGKKEQGQEETPQRKSLFAKFTEYIDKSNESWSNDNKKKGPRGKDLSPEEMKKKDTYTGKGFSSTYWNFGSGYPTLVFE